MLGYISMTNLQLRSNGLIKSEKWDILQIIKKKWKEKIRMTNSGVKITGIPHKGPQKNENGDYLLLYKISNDEAGTTGKPSSYSLYTIHIPQELWKKVSKIARNNSYYIIEG